MKIKLLLSIFSISVIIIAADKPDDRILYNNRNYIVNLISQCIASDGKNVKYLKLIQ